MPPRFTYWTILAGGLPTAFRAADREDLLPTFERLRQKHPDAEMKWFARGRLWSSPDEARAAQQDRQSPERKGPDWRPGGVHRDPRQRYADAKKARNAAQRQTRFDRKHGVGRGSGDQAGSRGSAPRERPHGDPLRDRNAPARRREQRHDPARTEPMKQPQARGGPPRDRTREWPERREDAGEQRTRAPRPGGREPHQANRNRERPHGDPFRARTHGPKRHDDRRGPPHSRPEHRPWHERPHGDPLRGKAGGAADRRRPPDRWGDTRDRSPQGAGWRQGGGSKSAQGGGWKQGGGSKSSRGSGWRQGGGSKGAQGGGWKGAQGGRKPGPDTRPPRGKPHGDPVSRQDRGGRDRDRGGFRGRDRPFSTPAFERRAGDEPPDRRYPPGPNREPRPGENPPPSPPPRPNEPTIVPPGPPERGRPRLPDRERRGPADRGRKRSR